MDSAAPFVVDGTGTVMSARVVEARSPQPQFEPGIARGGDIASGFSERREEPRAPGVAAVIGHPTNQGRQLKYSHRGNTVGAYVESGQMGGRL